MFDRQSRAIALFVLALTATAVASLFYLRSGTPTAKPVAATTLDRNLVTTDIVTYQFVSPTVGWAMVVLSGPSNRIGQSWLFSTVDGARHWRQQLAFNNGQLGRTPFGMSFVDEKNGFVLIRGFPDQLYRTTDGGSRWLTLSLPAAGAGLMQFTDRYHGWLVSSEQSVLYGTDDGGLNWVRHPSVPVDATYHEINSQTELWLGSLSSPTPHAYSSTDGAQTWQRRELPTPPEFHAEFATYSTEVKPLPKSGALATVRGSGFDEIYYFTSFDSGKTWANLPPPPGQLSFVDRTHWWAMSATTLFKSSDAGLTWTSATAELPELFDLRVVDSKHAWASTVMTGGDGLAVTSDGGLHWILRPVPHPNVA